jgi:hypothetical protein
MRASTAKIFPFFEITYSVSQVDKSPAFSAGYGLSALVNRGVLLRFFGQYNDKLCC